MSHRHAIVWIDHSQARVLFVDTEDVEKSIILPKEHPHLHIMSRTIGSGKAPEDQHFYHAVAEALASVPEILITGPGQAKLALFKHLQRHDPAVAEHVLGIESADHPTDGQLVAHARHYFKVKDRMLGI